MALKEIITAEYSGPITRAQARRLMSMFDTRDGDVGRQAMAMASSLDPLIGEMWGHTRRLRAWRDDNQHRLNVKLYSRHQRVSRRAIMRIIAMLKEAAR